MPAGSKGGREHPPAACCLARDGGRHRRERPLAGLDAVRLTSRYDFIDTAHLDLAWVVESAAGVEASGLLAVDPVAGASDLVPTNRQDLPADANELMRAYAARMPAEVADWWQARR